MLSSFSHSLCPAYAAAEHLENKKASSMDKPEAHESLCSLEYFVENYQVASVYDPFTTVKPKLVVEVECLKAAGSFMLLC